MTALNGSLVGGSAAGVDEISSPGILIEMSVAFLRLGKILYSLLTHGGKLWKVMAGYEILPLPTIPPFGSRPCSLASQQVPSELEADSFHHLF